jgi:hypothetical protein
MWDWKTDRRVHFAVGLAVCLLAAKWLFTGSLLYSVEAIQGEVTRTVWDDQGNVKSVPVSAFTAGWLPLIFDFAITVMIGIGARVLVGAMSIFSGVKQAASEPSKLSKSGKSEAGKSETEASASGLQLSEQDQMRAAVIDLGRAAAANDVAALEQLRIALRQPQAMRELQAAYQAGDIEAANRLTAELNAMLEPAKAAAKKRGGTNVQ